GSGANRGTKRCSAHQFYHGEGGQLTSFRQAAASAERVLHGIIWHSCSTVCTLLRYGHLFAGMGFIHTTRPAMRLASISHFTARGRSMVLVSERMSSVAEGPRTDGCMLHRRSRAVPRSVPRPYKPESRT